MEVQCQIMPHLANDDFSGSTTIAKSHYKTDAVLHHHARDVSIHGDCKDILTPKPVTIACRGSCTVIVATSSKKKKNRLALYGRV
jgi:hypothetical protein